LEQESSRLTASSNSPTRRAFEFCFSSPRSGLSRRLAGLQGRSIDGRSVDRLKYDEREWTVRHGPWHVANVVCLIVEGLGLHQPKTGTFETKNGGETAGKSRSF